MEERKQFTFYASFHEAAQALQSPEERGALYGAICDYALYGTEPHISGMAAAMFALIRPNLDASRRKAENRLGKKRTDNKPKTKQHQIKKKREDESECEKENENECEKENEYYILGVPGGTPADKPPSNMVPDVPPEPQKKPPARSKRFIPPTVEEVSAYCLERHNGIDPQHFVDFYEARGWMIGKNKMKDWKAAIRTWEQRNSKNNKQGGTDNGFDYDDPYSAILL